MWVEMVFFQIPDRVLLKKYLRSIMNNSITSVPRESIKLYGNIQQYGNYTIILLAQNANQSIYQEPIQP